jgi:hypothetical protein
MHLNTVYWFLKNSTCIMDFHQYLMPSGLIQLLSYY